jgi:hypothetical protein
MGNTRFRSFLKPQLRIDTIPKPVGLGLRSRREAPYGPLAFIEYSMNIRCSFNSRSAPVQRRYAAIPRILRVANGR